MSNEAGDPVEMVATTITADTMVLKVCIMQLVADQVRRAERPDEALASFAARIRGAMEASLPPSSTSFSIRVRERATKRLDELITGISGLLELQKT
jgi:hypothetical protein